ncbi:MULTISPECIES: hybrid sensor histidine kinase/response regulator [unclassified Lentimicrobium]|uniref:hybrid sensor histidine kinase/response regulator n=1 Tax=unclassified Lentimicrobium TaxID=2677434 RepID=UPI001554AC3C|nr:MULTISPECIES: hybrid sensor histidine kinase/response regulator [unclassified Lentimicrobium]NPD46774.1 hybrid sensor histidine kinase/response regulator [Lentimicrobium sp. S6]NPD85677.1 hybrid sensor histidine kinase/response regulator [Lentimicrobium sp. L6]
MLEDKKKVLIVDDSITNLQVIGKMLEREQFQVIFVESGYEALNLLKENYMPDILLLDIMMPGMSGFDFKEQINKHEIWKTIPVIVISALYEQNDKSTAFELGCVDFMVKPIHKLEVLHRINVQLNAKEQQRQLNTINSELQEANKSRDKIFSIISHDLRTSIGNIKNVFRFILDGLIDPKEDFELLSDAEITARNTYNLLENLLFWAKSQQGQIIYRPELINLSRLISGIVEMERGSIVSKEIELVEAVPADFFVWSDKVLLSIVVRNLLANAVKFTDEKGKIIIQALPDVDKIKLSIIDNGVGMNEEQLNKIKGKETFTSMGTHNEKGTGLGLILVKDYVETCNGEFEVKSVLNEGSEFIVFLPIEED